jgi:BON domain
VHPLRIALCAAAVVAMAGCGKNTKARDSALATDVEAKLYADPATKTGNIKVAAQDGVVTLSGDVPGSDVEVAAIKDANRTAGVRRVDDHMTVNGALAANPPAPLSATPDTSTPPVSASATSGQSGPPQSPVPSPALMQSATPSPEPAQVTIPAGERVTVRMIDSIDSARNETGQTFRATLSAPLVSHGRVVVPAGEPVSIILEYAKDAGHIRGRSVLELRLGTLRYHDRTYRIDSTTYEEQGRARGRSTAVRTGIGTAAGAIIGALAGGGKGAGIGALVGGGGTAGFQLATRGQQVRVPSESLLTFRLERPLTIDEPAG